MWCAFDTKSFNASSACFCCVLSPIRASLRPVSRAFKACAYLRVCVKVYLPAPVHPCGCARLGPEECHPEGPYFWQEAARS